MLTITVEYKKRSCTATVYGDCNGESVPRTVAKATGGNYCLTSAAMACALNDAGVKLPKRAESQIYSREKGFPTGGIGVSSIRETFMKGGFLFIEREVGDASLFLVFKKSELRGLLIY